MNAKGEKEEIPSNHHLLALLSGQSASQVAWDAADNINQVDIEGDSKMMSSDHMRKEVEYLILMSGKVSICRFIGDGGRHQVLASKSRFEDGVE